MATTLGASCRRSPAAGLPQIQQIALPRVPYIPYFTNSTFLLNKAKLITILWHSMHSIVIQVGNCHAAANDARVIMNSTDMISDLDRSCDSNN